MGRKKIPKKADGGPIDPIQQFYIDYIKSPKYKQRILEGEYINPEQTIKKRLENVSKTKIGYNPKESSSYDKAKNRINIDKSETTRLGVPVGVETLKSHEYAHAAGALMPEPSYGDIYTPLSERDAREIANRNRLTAQSDAYLNSLPTMQWLERMHDRKPSESKADLDTLRYYLKKDKIYDTGTQDFNMNHLNKARGKYRNNPDVKRLFDYFSDEDILWMMNHVAKNETNNTQPLAKEGMKVRPKYFMYEDLPCIHCKDKLMAASGMYMDPGPRIPGMKANMQALTREVPRELSPQMPQRVYDPSAIISTSQLPPIDTNKIKPNVPPPPKKDSVTPHQKGQKFNAASAALLAGQALSSMLAENPNRQTVVQPQMAYNPLNYGLGSQGIMAYGGHIDAMGNKITNDENNTPSARSGIYIKPSKRGTLHDALGIPRGEKIPASKLKDKPGDSPALKKKKLFARNARKWKHDDGGIVPFLFQGMEDLFGNIGDAADALINPASAMGGGAPLPIGFSGAEIEYGLDQEAKNGNWIQGAINPKHKGYCTPMTKSTCTPRRKALAKRFKSGDLHKGEFGASYDPMQNDPYTMITSKMDIGGFIAPGWDKYKQGGIIPDNMSVFNPHEYEHGGSVNGCAKVKEVGPRYPNTDLMEQWLLYANGGNVNGGAKLKDVNAKYPNSDLLEQWLLYANGGNVNGKAVIKDVNGIYPNADLMEQWLLYENGGQLSASKAKEMLKDGTANGKKLTAKQKRYFGMVAAGKAPNGGTKPDPNKPIIPKNNRPTTQDSLALYNNALQVQNYYKNRGYSQQERTMGKYIGEPTEIDYLDKWAREYDPNKLRTVPLKNVRPGEKGAAEIKLPKSQYRRDINPNQFYQREAADVILDTRAPMQLYDRRIQPNRKYSYENMNVNDPLYGDQASVLTYDPATIMPAFMRQKTSTTTGSARPSPRPAQRPIPPPPELNPVDIQGIIPTAAPNVRANVRPQTVSNETEFSATYRDPSMENKQRSIYFPNREAWRGFLGTGALGNVDTSETSTGAHATGYRTGMFRQGGYIDGYEPMAAARQRYAENGSIMYEDGGEIGTMWGGTAELESYNPYDGGTVEFNGPSHENGGIGMHYNGSPIEVEGGEYAARDSEGNLNIYGNMYIPGTKTKFKAAAGAIMKKEKRYDMLKTKGADLVNKANPANRFDQLRFNAGQVMMHGGQMGMQDLAQKKEGLADVQRTMLDFAAMQGLDPFEMSKGKRKKAKGGASIPFMKNGGSDPGGNDPTRADRNRNPGNIKYGPFAKKYGAKRDKDGFAIFPDVKTGEKAMRDLLTSDRYKNLPVRQAIAKWTDNHPYRYDLGPLTDKPVNELNEDELSIVLNTMRQGEGTRYGVTPRPVPGTPTNTPTPNVPTPTTPYTPYTIPNVPLDTPVPPIDPVDPVPPYDWLDVPEDRVPPSNVEPLGINNVLGEVYALATNRPEPVPAQRYEPQLFVPYQVSFQDRLNANQAVFNAQSRAVGAGNPAALGTLGAQKYTADQAVLADEFRTNQAIANDITNKNISLVNDANLKNLGIADTQMVRQSQARSKTRELNQMILNSISDKYAKNELENKKLAAYENLYDYRFVPTEDGGLRAQYMGPNAYFNYEGRNTTGQKPQDVRTISRYDSQGNLRGYNEYDESELKEQQRLLDMEMKRRKMPMMPLRPLDK